MNRVTPGPGEESVWDYPRPPKVEPCTAAIRVEYNGETVAATSRAWRLLETSHPPTYYIPREDVAAACLAPAAGTSICEWKGRAVYWDLTVNGKTSPNAAWSYPSPSGPYAELKDCVAFYATRVDACFVDGERVQPQPGGFYGGWITSKIKGPFKGEPGTGHW